MTDDTAKTSAIERVARVLAARDASNNAHGGQASIGRTVDESCITHQGDAVAVLKALRKPDDAVAAVGDGALWTRMIDAARGDAAGGGTRSANGSSEPLAIGSDPMIEGA